MSTLRFKAFDEVLQRVPVAPLVSYDKSSEIFGTRVFNKKAMRDFMPKGLSRIGHFGYAWDIE